MAEASRSSASAAPPKGRMRSPPSSDRPAPSSLPSPQSRPPPLSGPGGYARARAEAEAVARLGGPDPPSPPSAFVRTVEGRPYLPLLSVDPRDEASIAAAARAVASARRGRPLSDGGGGGGRVATIAGGLTNALFRVDLGSVGEGDGSDAVLVRIFGADGMIDRDAETAAFSRLCAAGGGEEGEVPSDASAILHPRLDLLGRFANGRVESWIPGMRPATIADLDGPGGVALAGEVARQMARLHRRGMDAMEAEELGEGPTLWRVIEEWIDELGRYLGRGPFACDDGELRELFHYAALGVAPHGDDAGDHPRMAEQDTLPLIIQSSLRKELAWQRDRVEARFPHAPVAFCHNDANAANILLDATINSNESSDSLNANKGIPSPSYHRESVCLIDYEYGSVNYAMFDVANFFCEHCGGNDNGVPNFDRFPDGTRIESFLREYVRERGGGRPEEAEVADLRAQVEAFRAASDLYWGVWGVLQAAREVSDGTFRREDARARTRGHSDVDRWDNLRYGRERLANCRRGRERAGATGGGPAPI
ncbi:hypothetical protein ACHAWF_008461 [Thalassiosira exigua]